MEVVALPAVWIRKPGDLAQQDRLFRKPVHRHVYLVDKIMSRMFLEKLKDAFKSSFAVNDLVAHPLPALRASLGPQGARKSILSHGLRQGSSTRLLENCVEVCQRVPPRNHTSHTVRQPQARRLIFVATKYTIRRLPWSGSKRLRSRQIGESIPQYAGGCLTRSLALRLSRPQHPDTTSPFRGLPPTTRGSLCARRKGLAAFGASDGWSLNCLKWKGVRFGRDRNREMGVKPTPASQYRVSQPIRAGERENPSISSMCDSDSEVKECVGASELVALDIPAKLVPTVPSFTLSGGRLSTLRTTRILSQRCTSIVPGHFLPATKKTALRNSLLRKAF